MELKVGVLTVSDRCFEKQATDESGPVVESLINNNTTLFKHFNSLKIEKDIVPDEAELISNKLIEWSDNQQYHLILTTGGTGFAPRDVTPEATKAILHKEAPGLVVAMISASLAITPHAMLARPAAGVRGNTLIVNLPGSPKGAKENLEVIMAALPHAVALINQLKGKDNHEKKPETKH
jgi:gephyrin